MKKLEARLKGLFKKYDKIVLRLGAFSRTVFYTEESEVIHYEGDGFDYLEIMNEGGDTISLHGDDWTLKRVEKGFYFLTSERNKAEISIHLY